LSHNAQFSNPGSIQPPNPNPQKNLGMVITITGSLPVVGITRQLVTQFSNDARSVATNSNSTT